MGVRGERESVRKADGTVQNVKSRSLPYTVSVYLEPRRPPHCKRGVHRGERKDTHAQPPVRRIGARAVHRHRVGVCAVCACRSGGRLEEKVACLSIECEWVHWAEGRFGARVRTRKSGVGRREEQDEIRELPDALPPKRRTGKRSIMQFVSNIAAATPPCTGQEEWNLECGAHQQHCALPVPVAGGRKKVHVTSTFTDHALIPASTGMHMNPCARAVPILSLALFALVSWVYAQTVSISGTGSSLALNFYQDALMLYSLKHDGVNISYTASGSGAGRTAAIQGKMGKNETRLLRQWGFEGQHQHSHLI